jgi:hypothetical protein
MTPDQWRMWFIQQRIELHNILIECLDKAPDQEAKLDALAEHDKTVAALVRYAARKVARTELVTVLAQWLESNQCSA